MKKQAPKPEEAGTQTMDLQYFLELVDHKHRHGSNLRKYHSYWRSQSTQQNFFYWLDYGEGKSVELSACDRARLEREQVRYLNREQRYNYLVSINGQGKLEWAKNGERVWTDGASYRDSVNGIVRIDDPSPKCEHPSTSCHSSSSASLQADVDGAGSEDETDRCSSLPTAVRRTSTRSGATKAAKKQKWIFVSCYRQRGRSYADMLTIRSRVRTDIVTKSCNCSYLHNGCDDTECMAHCAAAPQTHHIDST